MILHFPTLRILAPLWPDVVLAWWYYGTAKG